MSNTRYSLSMIALLVIFVSFQACKKEDSINRLPDITISASTITEKFIGDVLSLDPTVSYGGQETQFDYKWYKSVRTSTNVEIYRQISDKKALTYTLDSLGTFNLKLDVTNQTTGVTASSYSSFNVISRAERGWYVLKATAAGNTDLDAFFTTTAGSQKTSDIMLSKYGSSLTGLPVGLGFSAFYTWYNPATKAFVSNNLCLFPVSAKEAISYRIKDEKILANTDQLFFEPPALATRNFQALICDPNLMAVVNNGKISGMNPSSNSFLPERSGDYSISPAMTIAPYKYNNSNLGYILGYDQKNESFVNIRYKQTDVSYYPDKYLAGTKFNYPYNISSNKMNAKLVAMENTDGTLDSLLSSNGRAYAVMKKNTGSDMFILGLNTELLIPARYGNAGFSPIAFQQDLSAATYPELTSASLYTMNKNNPILYFAKGNALGSYNIETKVYTTNLLTLAAGEEISYIKFLDVQYDNITANNFRNLVVATYLNGNYKVYRYTVLGNTLTQVGTAFEGAGKVKALIYTIPTSTSTASYTSLFHSMYRYY